VQKSLISPHSCRLLETLLTLAFPVCVGCHIAGMLWIKAIGRKHFLVNLDHLYVVLLRSDVEAL
jgi:hypothetical protein